MTKVSEKGKRIAGALTVPVIAAGLLLALPQSANAHGWDPNDPLERSDFILIADIPWDSTATYPKGVKVSHHGKVYEAVQTHRGSGDPNWIHALALWRPIGTVAEQEPTVPVAPEPPVESNAWDSKAAYSAGAIVTHNGVTYRAVQSYRGVGDPNWIHAPSLWQPLS